MGGRHQTDEAKAKVFIDEGLEIFELDEGESIVFWVGERPPLPV